MSSKQKRRHWRQLIYRNLKIPYSIIMMLLGAQGTEQLEIVRFRISNIEIPHNLCMFYKEVITANTCCSLNGNKKFGCQWDSYRSSKHIIFPQMGHRRKREKEKGKKEQILSSLLENRRQKQTSSDDTPRPPPPDTTTVSVLCFVSSSSISYSRLKRN